MRVLIAGSHGFIGSALVRRLEEFGHEVTRLVRKNEPGRGEVSWDPNPSGGSAEVEAMEGFDGMINVGGIPISEKRWTERHKRELWTSRVSSTEILGSAIRHTILRPKVLVNASAVGFYGDRGVEELTETSRNGDGYLADMCRKWEEATQPVAADGIRVVNLRTGIVLGAGGGVLKQQIPMFKLCIGGRLGDGHQYMSWISLRDEVNAIVHILQKDDLEGPVNLTSPNPVRNADYTQILGEVLHRPTIVPAPRWMIAAALGAQLTDEVLLAGQYVVPEKLRKSGFQFEDLHLRPALEQITASPLPADDEGETA